MKDYDFEPILTNEEFKANKNKVTKDNQTKLKTYKLKSWVLITLMILALLGMTIILSFVVRKDERNQLEKVSNECSEKGQGVTTKYTNLGDKYFVCKVR